MDPVLLYTGDELARYGFGAEHPFGPDRQGAFLAELGRRGLAGQVEHRAPRRAGHDELLLFHTPDYLEHLQARCGAGGFLDDGDTPADPVAAEAAEWVVGTTLAAVDALMAGPATRALVPIAGLHHAARERAAGFCVYNDIGVAIEHLCGRHGLARVGYVDIDAHHGDGVYYAFETDPAVIVADIHEDGRSLYPGTGGAHETGTGAAAGTKLNLPLPAGAGDAEFRAAWDAVEAHLERHAPEFLILQCGADSLAGDPITHLRYSEVAHGHAARRLCDIAGRHAGGRVLALGGGGYDRGNLGRAWCAVVESLLESPSTPRIG